MTDNFRDLEPIVPTSRARRAIDEAINATMARQHGAISDDDLNVIGLDARAIRRRVRSNRLYEADIGSGIYTATPQPLSELGRRFATLLWAPPDGALADTTAASATDLERQQGRRVHVLYLGDVRKRPVPGIAAHPSELWIPEQDVYVDANGHRCTTAARTILDIAGGRNCSQHRVDSLVDRSFGIRLFDLNEYDRVRADRPKHPGTARLNTALRKLGENIGRHRSNFEMMTADLIKTRSDLPTPVINAQVHNFELDVWFPGTRAVIECDSRKFHSTPAQLARDARKRRILTHLGFVFLLLRWEQVAFRPEDGLNRILAHYRANAVPPTAKPGPVPA